MEVPCIIQLTNWEGGPPLGRELLKSVFGSNDCCTVQTIVDCFNVVVWGYFATPTCSYVMLHTTFLPLCLHKVPQPCQLLGKAESCRHYTTNILFCTLQSGSMNREPGCAAAQRRFEFLPSPLRYSHIYLTFNLNLFTVVEEGGE
jgi:hypothetical protein